MAFYRRVLFVVLSHLLLAFAVNSQRLTKKSRFGGRTFATGFGKRDNDFAGVRISSFPQDTGSIREHEGRMPYLRTDFNLFPQWNKVQRYPDLSYPSNRYNRRSQITGEERHLIGDTVENARYNKGTEAGDKTSYDWMDTLNSMYNRQKATRDSEEDLRILLEKFLSKRDAATYDTAP